MCDIIFLIHCADKKGLLAEISGFFYQRQYNILHCQQYTDVITQQYFMRIKLEGSDREDRKELEQAFERYAQQLSLAWSVHYSDTPYRIGLMVTKAGHCGYDLLLREQEGELNAVIPLVISNHQCLADMAKQFNKPFYYCPIDHGKEQQEASVRQLLIEQKIDLVVMARYMQILSQSFVEVFAGQIINIHHGFLPAFQGAKPYHQAYDRGVKIIGATAHYATVDLDDGPIIEQDTERVHHDNSPEDLITIGKDIERLVLARAVKAHAEHRIIISGRRTIVFSEGV
ncbi:MAG TPA: formyltetrahydrofolate deformylase [Gammaproteobacteria bacterium]|nr:formyltetrahydrofolate deformylase [Gammaproteobacteria bacterium]